MKHTDSTSNARCLTPKAFASRQFNAPPLQRFNASTLQRFNDPSIELHIQELMLHGFASGDRYAIGDAVERELARLLSEQGIPGSLRVKSQTDEIRGGSFNVPRNWKPLAIGQQIAHAVYHGLSQ